LIGLGEDARQKILIRQVFRRCLKIWTRHKVLAPAPIFYALSDLSQKELFAFEKLVNNGKKEFLRGRREHCSVTRWLRTGRGQKSESIRMTLSDLDQNRSVTGIQGISSPVSMTPGLFSHVS
jgi:hypothetical protein